MVLAIGSAGPALAAGRPITAADLLAMQRVSEPQLSPDGSRTLYMVGVPDLTGNRTGRNVWIVPTAGGEGRALTSTGKDSGARWAPDGRRIAFISTRGGSAQIYTSPPTDPASRTDSRTSQAAPTTRLVAGRRTIAFTSEVYPDRRDEACNGRVPGRRTLDSETAQQSGVVRRSAQLARQVSLDRPYQLEPIARPHVRVGAHAADRSKLVGVDADRWSCLLGGYLTEMPAPITSSRARGLAGRASCPVPAAIS